MGYEARRKKVLEDTNSINDKAKQNLTETQYDLWQKQVEEKMKAFNAKEAAKTDKMYLFYSIIYVLCILLAISAVVVGVFFILRDLEPRPETTYVGPNRITSIIFELILTEGMIGVVIFGIKALRKGVVAIITSEQEIKTKGEVFVQIIEGKRTGDKNCIDKETIVGREAVESDTTRLARNLKDEIERNKKCEGIYIEIREYYLLRLFGAILTTLSSICLFCIPFVKSATGEAYNLLSYISGKIEDGFLTEIIKIAEKENEIYCIVYEFSQMMSVMFGIMYFIWGLYVLYVFIFKMSKMKSNINKRFIEGDEKKQKIKCPISFTLNLVTRIIFALLLYLGNSYVFRNLEENPLIEVSYLPFILCLVLYIIGSACSTKADYILKKSDNVKRNGNYL